MQGAGQDRQGTDEPHAGEGEYRPGAQPDQPPADAEGQTAIDVIGFALGLERDLDGLSVERMFAPEHADDLHADQAGDDGRGHDPEHVEALEMNIPGCDTRRRLRL